MKLLKNYNCRGYKSNRNTMQKGNMSYREVNWMKENTIV